MKGIVNKPPIPTTPASTWMARYAILMNAAKRIDHIAKLLEVDEAMIPDGGVDKCRVFALRLRDMANAARDRATAINPKYGRPLVLPPPL